MTGDPVTFGDVTPPDDDAARAALTRLAGVAVPAGAGATVRTPEPAVARVAGWLAARGSSASDCRLVIFAGDNGVVTDGPRDGGRVTLLPEGFSSDAADAVGDGSAPVVALAHRVDAALRLVDTNLHRGPAVTGTAADGPSDGDRDRWRVRDSSGAVDREDAMSDDELEAALRVGRDVADREIDGGADQDLSSLAAGAEVIVRGLGMGFTDAVTLLTVGRGGRFVRDAAARSGLRYVPSGREPRIVASSHRGYPFLPKPEFGAMPPTPSMPRLTALLDRFGPGGPDTEPGSLDATDPETGVWPAVVRDAHEEFLRTLLTSTVGTPGPLLDRARAVIDAARDPESLHRDPGIRDIIAEAVGGPAAGGSGSGDDAALPCLDIPALMDPVGAYRPGDGAAGGAGADPGANPVADFTAWVGDRLVDDLREAAAGRDSALRAGLRVIGAARTPVHLIGQAGRYTAASRPAVARLTAFGQMVGSGPPAFRTRELLALADAGVVRFAGAHPTVVVDPEAPAFVLTSPTTGDHPVAAPALLDAWMHGPDVRSSADPLTAALVAAGRVRPFTPGADGRPTRSPDVDLPSTRVIGADGTPDPRVHLVGIPLQELRAGTTVSPVPGTDPLMLRE
ncbi:nicotinate-nucleotide--dimethylbenzimidazole phosphoribosyltransferase, partial [Corynebacterium bovis]|uniref:nicotinate-nucleotide--dimethylbenzimidazole phosphoribosyltransferase n=1 Tax=Corynebacterium bovis TaxID=36808 RepID=UPI0036CE3314